MRKIFIFYFTKEYTFIYIKNSKKEIIDKVNNTFMKYSEIIDYNRFIQYLNYLKNKYLILNTFLKPIIYVLYNDISFTDIKYIYSNAFKDTFYPYSINFIKISDLNYNGKLVYYDDCYTNLNKRTKFCSESFLSKKSILVGKVSNKHLHFSDKYYFWSKIKETIQKY